MSEKDLIEKSKQGDGKSFEQLFDLYRNRIYQHVLGIVKNEESAKDITQETFLKAFLHLSAFREESSFYTWIFRISHNLSLNYLKKTKGHPTEELKEQFIAGITENGIEEREFANSLAKALTHLSPAHRQIYELCEIEGLSQKEVAKKLNIPTGTVRSRLHYARKKLQRYLSNSSNNFL